jgi:hypothetical protein
MPRKRLSNEQIAFALRQMANGMPVEDICRKMGVSESSQRYRKRCDPQLAVRQAVQGTCRGPRKRSCRYREGRPADRRSQRRVAPWMVGGIRT